MPGGKEQERSRKGGGSKVGRAPVTDPGGKCLVAGREVEREMREREGRINVKLQGSRERLPEMKLAVKKGKSV